MQRILFWLGLILLINWWWRKNSGKLARRMRDHLDARAGQPQGGPFQQPREQAPRQFRGPSPQAAASAQAEPMACCAQCETYIPLSEAIGAGPRYFCCAEHARQFASHAA